VKSDSNEQILLKGLANNDSKAIDTIYKDNFNMVQALILNNNGSYDDARDIFQEAIITLYEKAKSESFILTCQIKNIYLLRIAEIMAKTASAIGQIYITG